MSQENTEKLYESIQDNDPSKPNPTDKMDLDDQDEQSNQTVTSKIFN